MGRKASEGPDYAELCTDSQSHCGERRGWEGLRRMGGKDGQSEALLGADSARRLMRQGGFASRMDICLARTVRDGEGKNYDRYMNDGIEEPAKRRIVTDEGAKSYDT